MAKTTVPIELSSTPSIVDNGNATAITIDSSENVGIGTSSPNAYGNVTTLTINGTNQGRLDVEYGGTHGGSFLAVSGETQVKAVGASQVLTFEVNNAERMRIDSSGNFTVGGTTAGNAGVVNISVGSPSTTIGGMQLWSTTSGSHFVQFGDAASGTSYYRGAIGYDHATDSLQLWSASTERMRIDSSGNVGIGTSSPSRQLHLSNSSDHGIIAITGGTSSLAGIVLGDTADDDVSAVLHNNSGNYLYFTTSTTERMRIDSSGDVLINSTSATGAEKVHIAFNRASEWGLVIANTSSTAPSNATMVDFRYAGTQTGSIGSDGTNTSYNTSSDYRLKENVTYDWDATTRLKQLKPARFNFISNADTTVDGFLAHEVSSIVPEAIVGEKDAVDDEGNAVYQGIDQSKLVPLLVKTIQELEARITALEGN